MGGLLFYLSIFIPLPPLQWYWRHSLFGLSRYAWTYAKSLLIWYLTKLLPLVGILSNLKRWYIFIAHHLPDWWHSGPVVTPALIFTFFLLLDLGIYTPKGIQKIIIIIYVKYQRHWKLHRRGLFWFILCSNSYTSILVSDMHASYFRCSQKSKYSQGPCCNLLELLRE